MPTNPTFQATLSAWRTVLDAIRQYKSYLVSLAPTLDENTQLIADDDIERLDRIIPGFESQLGEQIKQATALSE